MQTTTTLAPIAKPANAAEATPGQNRQEDVPALVAGIAKRKATVGETFSGKKGKGRLFAMACAALKSLRGLSKADKLPSDTEAEVREAVSQFWQMQANRLLSYGTVTSATFDKPSVKVDTETGAVALKLKATLKAERPAADSREEKFMLGFALKNAKKRMDMMLDSLDKYEQSERAEQSAKIVALENRIVALGAEIAKQQS